MTGWPFGHLQMFGYDVIDIDPAWDFELFSEAGEKKSAKAHYDTMSLAEIMALPVGQLARRDTLVTLWTCEWMTPGDLQRVLDAWGCVYKTAIIWRKTTRKGKVRMGPGYRARTMHERVVIATYGNPAHKAFPSVFDGVAREHSRKPEEFYSLMERCCPKASKAMLFSRQSRAGWDTWGHERTKFDAPQPEQKLQGTRASFVIPDEFGLPALFDALPEQRREQGRLIHPA